VLFHHDNAPVHSSAVAQQKITEWRFELLAHPPYSPDLGPSDFHLFPKLKKFLAGKRFRSNEEVINAVNTYFEALEESHFREGIEKLEKRWTKCRKTKYNLNQTFVLFTVILETCQSIPVHICLKHQNIKFRATKNNVLKSSSHVTLNARIKHINRKQHADSFPSLTRRQILITRHISLNFFINLENPKRKLTIPVSAYANLYYWEN
jgi:transposase